MRLKRPTLVSTMHVSPPAELHFPTTAEFDEFELLPSLQHVIEVIKPDATVSVNMALGPNEDAVRGCVMGGDSPGWKALQNNLFVRSSPSEKPKVKVVFCTRLRLGVCEHGQRRQYDINCCALAKSDTDCRYLPKSYSLCDVANVFHDSHSSP